MTRIAVIGGGISGLAAAHAASARGEVLCFEAGDEPGGKIGTLHRDGHILDTGPSSFLGGEEDFEVLLRDLGLEEEVLPANPTSRARYVLFRGKPERIPMGPFSLLRTPLLSWGGLLRVFTEPLRRRGALHEEESVRRFFTRRLGPQVADRFADPFVSGVYAGDADTISARAAFPRITDLERDYRSLFLGLILHRRPARQPESPPRRKGIFTLREGMKTLPLRLAERLGDSLRCGCAVRGVVRRGARWSLRIEDAHAGAEVEVDEVILACPAREAAEIIEVHAPHAAQALREIPYVAVALRFLSYPLEALESWQGFGFLVPSTETCSILGALWNSSMFENRAPRERFLVTAFLGGARRPSLAGLPDTEQSRIARTAVEDALHPGTPPLQEWSWTHRRAIAQYNRGHRQRVGRAREAIRHLRGVRLTGSYLDGVGIPQCVASGLAAGRGDSEEKVGSLGFERFDRA